MMRIGTIIPIAAIAVAAVFAFIVLFPQPSSPSFTPSNAENGLAPIVPLEKIVSGGVPKDGIPSIDRPDFVSAERATFLRGDDLVIGLRHNGETKAYPLMILVWHEIVNDEIGGLPVAVTYCPLCFTNMVFERTIDGNIVQFGVSGKLYNSNLIMYDRLSNSYWSQAMAMGVAGQYTGYELKRVPFDVAFWDDWKELYPETLVLTTNTGHIRSYGQDPYGGYYTSPNIFFPVENRDDRLGPKEIVMGFEHNNVQKAYRLDDIVKQKVINDSIDDKNVLLVSLQPFMARGYDRTLDGQVLEFQLKDNMLTDVQTGSEWNFEGEAVNGALEGKQLTRLALDPSFWFSWAAFYPDTKLYSPN